MLGMTLDGTGPALNSTHTHGKGQARSEHVKGAALVGLRSGLEGKLRRGLGAQVFMPHPAGDAQKGVL